jgi:hypothetical protein
MPLMEVTYRRSVAVDATAALALWNEGKTIDQIRLALAPTACRMSVVRALRRAVRAGGVKLPNPRRAA